MIHHIIVKFNDQVTDKAKIAKEAYKLFSGLKGQNGIHNVSVHQNCIFRDNRFDMMIAIEMDKDALEFYDQSSQHKEWKRDYSCYILNKVIFDYED